jgi:hypothetical protein
MAVIVGVTAQQAQFNAAMQQAAAAMNQFAAAANNASTAATRTSTATRNTANTFQHVDRSVRVMRGQFQNLGFQIQDVVVQLQMGTDPIRVFTQQAGQIAQIFGPMGAAAGIALTTVGALIGVIANLGRETEATADKLDKLKSGLDQQVRTIDTLKKSYREMGEAQLRALTFSQQQKYFDTMEQLNKVDRDLRAQIRTYEDFGKALKEAVPGAGLAGALLSMLGSVQKLSPEVERLVEQFRQTGDIQAFAESLRPLAMRAGEGSERFQALATAANELAALQAELQLGLDATSNSLQALKDIAGGSKTTFDEFMDSVKDSIDLMIQVAKDRAKARDEAQKEAEQRAKTVATLRDEVEGLQRLNAAYGQGAEAARDAEIATAQQNALRRLEIDQTSALGREIADLVEQKERESDANKLLRQGRDRQMQLEILQAEIAAGGEITAELQTQIEFIKLKYEWGEKAARQAQQDLARIAHNQRLRDEAVAANAVREQLAQQRLLVRFGVQETEEYRVQLRLLQAKQQFSAAYARSIEDEVRESERLATIIREAEAERERMTQLFENALESIQDSFASTFEQIYQGGITTFSDLASAIKDIFIRLAAEITALMVIRPLLAPVAGSLGIEGFGGGFFGGSSAPLEGSALALDSSATALTGSAAALSSAAAAISGSAAVTGGGAAVTGGGAAILPASAPAGVGSGFFTNLAQAFGFTRTGPRPLGAFGQSRGWQWAAPGALGTRGLLTAGALGALGGNLIGSQFGGAGGIGGSLGGGVGAVLGGLTPLGPIGAIGGGLAGSLLGGAIGGLFGGGGGQSNRIRPGGALGLAGLGGTGAGAQFVQGIDRQLIDFLNSRQEQVVSAALAAAPRVSVQYSRTPSAGDLERLARGRIGPAAQALGLRPELIAPTGAAPEQMMQNLQAAVGLMRQIEGFRIGPIATQFRDLNDEFEEMRAEAERLGVSIEGLAEEQARANQLLGQDIRQQIHGIMEMVGATSSLGRALGDLDAEMRKAWIEAERYGVSTANLARTHHLAAQQLIQEDRLRRHASLEAVGLWSPLQRALGDLDAQMNLAAIEAERLGYSTAGLAAEHQRLAAAIIREHEATVDALALSITEPFEQLLDPLRQFAQQLTFGNLNPAGQIQAAQEEFERIASLAMAGSTTAIQQLQGAGEAFIAQAERFGASPGGVAAREQVRSVVESVMTSISEAQAEAMLGVEDVIRQASQREVDTLRELIDVGRLQIEEIKRLRR